MERHPTLPVLPAFCLRAACYGLWELWAISPEMTLAALRLRKGMRFTYERASTPWPRSLAKVVLVRRTDLLDDEDTRCRLEKAVERSKAREHAQCW